ncbi:MAG: diguanylate cyclase domain-containing protein [Oceanobacter sp.]
MLDAIESLEGEVQKLKREIAEREAHSRQLELVIAATGVGIWDWQVQTGKTEFNERWANIIGYTLEELSPVSIETWLKYAHPEDLVESERLLKAHWAGETDYYLFESRMKHKDGHWVWVYDTGRVIEWESPGVPARMIGTHLDITEQKNTQLLLSQANAELETLIRIDPLSGLANRRGYDERIAEELANSFRNGSALSLLMIDIDHFKRYNDEYGHEKGDRVIQMVASQLKASLHRKTDFVARYGGEEFIVLLPATGLQDAQRIAEKLRQEVMALNVPHIHSAHYQTLTISIGIASTSQKIEVDPCDILKQADKALYFAKEAGRNCSRCL